jgi:hypothetical protein
MPGDPIPRGLREPFRLLRLAAGLVPQSLRAEWLREWEAEVWYAARSAASHAAKRRGLEGVLGRLTLLRFAAGALPDAASYWTHSPHRADLLQSLRWRVESPGFCLAALSALIALIVAASGCLPRTHTVLAPLAYRDADRIATVSQGSARFAARYDVPVHWIRLWNQESRLTEGAAVYYWRKEPFQAWPGSSGEVRSMVVSDNFFPLLGARYRGGAEVSQHDLCEDCVLLSSHFARRAFGAEPPPGARLTLGRRSYQVAGVLHPDFWFLSKEIGAWRRASPAYRNSSGSLLNGGAVVRLAPGVSEREAESELREVLEAAGSSPWYSFIDVSPLQRRVRAVFGSFALALSLAAVMVLVSLGLRRSAWRSPRRWRVEDLRRVLFFGTKVLLLVLAVLLAGLEFTRATEINMIGGTDPLTEPVSSYLFLAASLGALTWAVRDQRRRCRVCLRRLGLAAQVGCPGCLLLDWSGTELVCQQGHGMLHVPEVVPCWREPERWTALDESWMVLFARKPS